MSPLDHTKYVAGPCKISESYIAIRTRFALPRALSHLGLGDFFIQLRYLAVQHGDTKRRGLVCLEFFDDNISCKFCRIGNGPSCSNAAPLFLWIFCGFLLDLMGVYTVDTSTGLFLFVIQYIVHTKANRLNHYSLLYTGRGTGI